jgi:hypothetical protein
MSNPTDSYPIRIWPEGCLIQCDDFFLEALFRKLIIGVSGLLTGKWKDGVPRVYQIPHNHCRLTLNNVVLIDGEPEVHGSLPAWSCKHTVFVSIHVWMCVCVCVRV